MSGDSLPPCSAVELSCSYLVAYKVLGGDMTLADMRNDAWSQDALDGKGSLQHPYEELRMPRKA